MSEEIWKKIKGTSNYFVSSFGRVKRVKKNKEIFLNAHKDSLGYVSVSVYLRKLKKSKTHFIGKLVLETFYPEDNKKFYTIYKDKDKSNVRLSNLKKGFISKDKNKTKLNINVKNLNEIDNWLEEAWGVIYNIRKKRVGKEEFLINLEYRN